ncbi:hypothetical protein M3Y96_00619800 [Aphelenchoides besseyi]|nr:hypothetical protein M3Y96_00619800 [Aphelenchoides besseyi]
MHWRPVLMHDLTVFVVFAFCVTGSSAYGTTHDGGFMTAVKNLIFGNEMPPNGVNTSNSQPMRHYALPVLPQPTPQVFAVQPAYPQYYVGPHSENPCHLPQQVGTGPYRIPRWYYNAARMRCELFYWSGCCANANNFANLQSCQQQCEGGKPNTVVFVPFTLTFTMKPADKRPAPQTTVALPAPPSGAACTTPDCLNSSEKPLTGRAVNQPLPPTVIPVSPSTTTTAIQLRPTTVAVSACEMELDEGVGSMNFLRYYYDRKTRMCKEFRFRGSGSNKNNFVSLPACRNACREAPSPCADGAVQPVRCSPGSVLTTTCTGEQFCHNGPTPETTVCCNRLTPVDPCNQPMNVGIGNSNLQRWFFNSHAQLCQPLIYRGLQGNENNFIQRDQCEAQCQINPCRVGNPYRTPTGVAYCSATDQSMCPAGFYCATAQTSVCCQALVNNPCSEQKQEGDGNSYSVRYYFDKQKNQCLPFNFGGIKGGQNNFLSQEACERKCPVWTNPCARGQPILGLNNKPETCNVEKPCRMNYYCHIGYDNDSTVCCPGAGNPCTLPMTSGTGPHLLNRWFFNSLTRQCERFAYRGLHGNSNNFNSQSQCEATCPAWDNPCPVGNPYLAQNSLFPETCDPEREDSCASTYWCHNGLNNRTRVCCPGRTDPCILARTDGEGNTIVRRWYFDVINRQCQPFTFRGLKGNANNFITREACESRCLVANIARKPEASMSSVAVVINPCPHGNPLTKSDGQFRQCRESSPCPRSYYCHIGETETTTVCCPADGTDPCGQPLESGTGGARLQRWYWNQQGQCCQPFNYCGLKGTQNNFLSRQDCERTCLEFDNPCAGGAPELGADFKPKQCGIFNECSADRWCHQGQSAATTVCCPHRVRDEQICQLPLECGQGTANLQRWYFDSRSGCCRPFIYKGRLGNQNSFLSQQDCQAACVAGSLIRDVEPKFINVCPFGIPLISDTTKKPVQCTFNNEEEVCGDRHWCHLSLIPEENQCCSGEPRAIAACGGRALLDTGVSGPEGIDPVERWMYDIKTGMCVNFTFNGRASNQNNFLNEEDCLQLCKAVNPCKLPIPLPLQQCVPGPNSCGNNPQLYCHVGAVPQTTVCCPLEGNPCSLPLDPGVGDARLERWFYNAEINVCQPFTYAGLKGNANNYLTQLQCEDQCVPNPCAEGRPFVGADGRQQTCSASASMSSCPTDYWCHIGAIQQTTVCCPGASRNPCNLPMSTGEGDAQLERFYYDQASKTCKPFLYRGLKGNQNNFLTARACQLACQPLDNPCIGQPATTPTGQVLFCSATNKDTCPVNFWCHLGATPETTVCCPGATNPCSVPLAPGTGNAGLSRWYYNPDERQCVPFQYNGKRGNQNNFLTQSQMLCLLSIDKGACSGRQTRYAYNRQTSQCVPFEYTGCGGNLNNFISLANCQETCGNVGF